MANILIVLDDDYRFTASAPIPDFTYSALLGTLTAAGHTVAQHARDLKAFCEALGLEDVVVVGWSMGSLIASVRSASTSSSSRADKRLDAGFRGGGAADQARGCCRGQDRDRVVDAAEGKGAHEWARGG